jgi:septum formation protein
MLRALSGRRHDVVTGVALVKDGRAVSGREVCGVVFARMSEEEISRYAATGEPDDKAGAYALQGIGGLFVSAVEGSPSNVVGLPLTLLYKLAREIGVDLL